jgi:hypothetical protein
MGNDLGNDLSGSVVLIRKNFSSGPDMSQDSPHNRDRPIVRNPTEARAGVVGHNVRYVLAISLAGVIVLFLLVAVAYFG